MEIQVSAIQFSRIGNGPGAQALRLRKNALEILPFPEWQRNLTKRAEDSRVAYTIEDVRNSASSILILVKFRISGLNHQPTTLRIRAAEPDVPLSGTPWEILLNTHINVLGAVKEKEVLITQNGDTAWIPFELRNVRLVQLGVGIYQVAWTWQQFIPSLGLWKDFDVTHHQVYTLLEQPTAPWAQESVGDLQLPWTDVLDYACTWAARSLTVDEAAANITRQIFSMGPTWFEYNCVNFLPAYVHVINFSGQSYFSCMEFLQHLKTRNVNRFIICTDCAAIVSTFSNILGCDLWQSTMQTPGTMFRTNRILAIGAINWQMPCGIPGFSYHEVAWKGDGGANDPIFDACLAIDATDNPQDLLSVPLLPANMLLGPRGSGLYRDKLVLQQDWNLAEPRPNTRERRLPFLSFVSIRFPHHSEAAVQRVEDERVNAVKQRLGFETWKNRNQLPESLLIYRFFLDMAAFTNWEIQTFEEVPASSESPRFIHTIWRSRDYLDGAMRVDFYECPSRLRAHEFMMRLLVNVHTSVDQMRPFPDLGDIAFSSSRDRGVLFARANLVVMISKANRSEVPVVSLAQQIDGYLYHRPPVTGRKKVFREPKRKGAAQKRGNRIMLAQLFALTGHHEAEEALETESVFQVEGALPLSETGRTFFKIFSSAEDLTLDKDELSYQPVQNEPVEVFVCSVQSNQQTDVHHIEIS